ncbi:MAG: archease [Nitrososphaerales archaeon]
MPFRYLPDIALADIAFEAESDSVNGLFESSALALSDVMVDPGTLGTGTTRKVRISSDNLDTLLYDFLTEIIVVKDVDSLLFREIQVEVAPDHKSLEATMEGEPINRERHTLRNDVKAVTMHLFGVRRESERWRATVVLDI